MNEEYRQVTRRLAAFAPDWFSALSADLTVASGANTIDISSLTDLMQILEVQRKHSTDCYRALPAASHNAERGCRLSWRQRGFPGTGCVVELQPARSAPGAYRVRYAAAPTDLAGSGAVKLPLGGDQFLVEAVAVRIRMHEEEDPSPHIAARDRAYNDLRNALIPQGYVISGWT